MSKTKILSERSSPPRPHCKRQIMTTPQAKNDAITVLFKKQYNMKYVANRVLYRMLTLQLENHCRSGIGDISSVSTRHGEQQKNATPPPSPSPSPGCIHVNAERLIPQGERRTQLIGDRLRGWFWRTPMPLLSSDPAYNWQIEEPKNQR